jgi:hypothetical protein
MGIDLTLLTLFMLAEYRLQLKVHNEACPERAVVAARRQLGSTRVRDSFTLYG